MKMSTDAAQRMKAYKALGLSANADADAVQRAYRALVRKNHPDQQSSGHADATARLAELNAAFDALQAERAAPQAEEPATAEQSFGEAIRAMRLARQAAAEQRACESTRAREVAEEALAEARRAASVMTEAEKAQQDRWTKARLNAKTNAESGLAGAFRLFGGKKGASA